MPHNVTLNALPAGYALSAARPLEEVEVAVTEFTSSEDGELFVSRLEGLPSELLALVPQDVQVTPSTVDHLVAVIRGNLTATVYVNECAVVANVRAARAMNAGDGVGEDDILDIATLRFEDVHFPTDAGLVVVFSAGWRKALFFDLAPLFPDAKPRAYDVEATLGSYYAYVFNQRVFSLTDKEWQMFFDQRWFPFSSIPKHLVRDMIAGLRSGLPLDTYLPQVADSLRALVPRLQERWSGSSLLREHVALLRRALERFLAEDYESATAILYPRIEGILRSIAGTLGPSVNTSTKSLASIPTMTRLELHKHTWLLPEAFNQFLTDVYFANFQPGTKVPLSRHSVGHGVADALEFDLKSATIGLLIVDQLWSLLPETA